MVEGASLVSSRARASAASKSSPSASSLRSRSCALRRTAAGTAGAVRASRASRTGDSRGSSCANAALSLPRSRASDEVAAQQPGLCRREGAVVGDPRGRRLGVLRLLQRELSLREREQVAAALPFRPVAGAILREQPDARARLPRGDEGAAAAPPLGRRQISLGFGRGLPDEGRRRLRGVRRRRFENEGPRGVSDGGAVAAREAEPDPRDAHLRDLTGRCGGVGREREHLRGFPVFAALLEQARDDDRGPHAEGKRPFGGKREPRLGQRLVGLAGVLERLGARQVPVGLEADGRGRGLETLRRRVEVLPARVVLREQKRDARIPGGLAGPAPDLDQGRLPFVALAGLEQVRGAGEVGVEVRGRLGSAEIGGGEARDQEEDGSEGRAPHRDAPGAAGNRGRVRVPGPRVGHRRGSARAPRRRSCSRSGRPGESAPRTSGGCDRCRRAGARRGWRAPGPRGPRARCRA